MMSLSHGNRKGISLILLMFFCISMILVPVFDAAAVEKTANAGSFAELQQALQQGADIIYLINDITITQDLIISEDVVIDGGDHILAAADGVSNPISIAAEEGEVKIENIVFRAEPNTVHSFIYKTGAGKLILSKNEFHANNAGNDFQAAFIQMEGESSLQGNAFYGPQQGIGIFIQAGAAQLKDNMIQLFQYGIQAAVDTKINGVDISEEQPSYQDYKKIGEVNVFINNQQQLAGIGDEEILWTEPVPSTDNTLKSLRISYGGEERPLSPGFHPNQLKYICILPLGETDIDEINVSAEASHTGAGLEISLDSEQMQYCITVIAENGQPRVYTIAIKLGVKLEAWVSDDSVTMNEDNRTLSRDQSWSIDITNGTVKDKLQAGEDIIIEGLPAGLSYTSRKGTRNNIIITVSGKVSEQEEAISTTREVSIKVLPSAVKEAWVLEKAELTVKIYPGGVIHVRAQAKDDSIRLLAPDFKTPDPEDDSWEIHITRGTVKKEVDKDDIELIGLPAGLDYDLKAGLGNTLLITVFGLMEVPFDQSLSALQLVVKGSAVTEEGAIDAPALTVRIERGGPRCIRYEPAGSGWFDESDLFAGKVPELKREQQLFLRLTFEDKGELELTDDAFNAMRRSMVNSQGGSQESRVDLEFLDYLQYLDEGAWDSFIESYLFKKDPAAGVAYVYIPIKPLRPQSVYDVVIAAGIVRYPGGPGNEPVQWSFQTSAYPQVSSISPGSVGENYGRSESILIKGDHFYQQGTVEVFFNDIPARRVEIINDKGQTYLEVYLPIGSQRLCPGLYDITVVNKGSYQETLYGQFSVIKAAAKPLPLDGEQVKDYFWQGDVIASINDSQDTLELNGRFSNRSYLQLDLDKLMGEDTWQRRIVYDSYGYDRIDQLKLISHQAVISLYGVGSSWPHYDSRVEIYAGRAAPLQAQSLLRKLGRTTVCSEVIEVRGNNLGVDRVELTIPYRNTAGKTLQLMRYDEFTRSWHEVWTAIDPVNQTVITGNTRPGYFVVIERG